MQRSPTLIPDSPAVFHAVDQAVSICRAQLCPASPAVVETTLRKEFSDPRLHPALREGYRELGVRAFLGVPVTIADQVIGVLTVRTSRDEGFSAADVEMATAFASQAAIALENSRLKAVSGHPGLRQVKGDIRDRRLLERELTGVDAVIHLACISNDPSFELNPGLGKSINYDAFLPLVEISKDKGVSRFIYASSSSVYGIKEEENVTEDLPLEPLTDYSKYKALCEEVLLKARAPGFTSLILRPATVCGYSPRLRLDLAVNILTNLAVNTRRITVFGGAQKRPNIHIEDVTDLYVRSLEWPAERIDGQIFNAGYENHTVSQLADMVAGVVGRDRVEIASTPTDDHRSYHISSERIKRMLSFEPAHSVEEAVRDLAGAYDRGWIPNAMSDKRYYNIKTMLEAKL